MIAIYIRQYRYQLILILIISYVRLSSDVTLILCLWSVYSENLLFCMFWVCTWQALLMSKSNKPPFLVIMILANQHLVVVLCTLGYSLASSQGAYWSEIILNAQSLRQSYTRLTVAVVLTYAMTIKIILETNY